MAGILKRMEEMELINKLPMQDQRRIRITLTAKAQALFLVIQQQVTEEYMHIEENLGKKTIQELYVALDNIIDNV